MHSVVQFYNFDSMRNRGITTDRFIAIVGHNTWQVELICEKGINYLFFRWIIHQDLCRTDVKIKYTLLTIIIIVNKV